MAMVLVLVVGVSAALCNGSCGLGMTPNRFHSGVPPQSALFTNSGLALFHECLMRATETKCDFTCLRLHSEDSRGSREGCWHTTDCARVTPPPPHVYGVRMRRRRKRREQDGPVISAPRALPVAVAAASGGCGLRFMNSRVVI